MRNMITTARFVNLIDQGDVSIFYSGDGFNGRITIHITEFFPCSDARLRKVLKEYREPLGGEYAPLCWSLYHWLEDLSKYCGAHGKAYGNKVLKNMDILAKELNIQ